MQQPQTALVGCLLLLCALTPLLTRAQFVPTGLVARWDFNEPNPTRDRIGNCHGVLNNGAAISNGRLVVNPNNVNQNQFMHTSNLPFNLGESTLEVWVKLARLDQCCGGALGVEVIGGSAFNTIVYNEPNSGRGEDFHWLPGSEFFTRTRLGYFRPEDSATREFVHIVATYSGNTISMFRNGELMERYGIGFRSFQANNARFIFGMRHTGGGRAFLQAEIDEARVYGRVLTDAEVYDSYWARYVQLAPAFPNGVIRENAWRLVRNEVLANVDQVPFTGVYSYMFWVRPLSVRGGWANLFHKGQDNVNRNPAIWFYPGSTQLHVRTGTNPWPDWGNGGNHGCDPGYQLPMNQWTHVTLIHDGTGIKVYLNAFIACQSDCNGPVANRGPLIGVDPWHDVPDAFMADFRYFGRTLTWNEINLAYTQRRGLN